MGILSRFRAKPAEAPAETRSASSWAALVASLDGHTSTVSPEACQNLSAYTAAINAVADTVASLPLRLYRQTQGGRVEVTNTPLAALLRNPNPNASAFDWVRTAVGGVMSYGNHISTIERDGTGQVVALTPVPWTDVAPILVGGVLAFDIQPANGGLRRRWLGHEVLFLRERADGDGLVGRSRLSRAPMVAQATLGAQEFAASMFRNQAVPSGAVEIEAALTQPQYERLREQFSEKYTGAANARKVLILDNKAKWQSLSGSASDLDLLLTRKWGVEEIARVMGVPAAIIGEVQHNTFASASQTHQWFCTQSIAPMARCIESAFARTVLPSDMHIEIDMAGLQRGDFETRWKVWTAAVAAGLLSVAEVREMEGFGAPEAAPMAE